MIKPFISMQEDQVIVHDEGGPRSTYRDGRHFFNQIMFQIVDDQRQDLRRDVGQQDFNGAIVDAIVVVVIVIDIPNRILDYTRQICRFARYRKALFVATQLHRGHRKSNEGISVSNVVGGGHSHNNEESPSARC
jgi:hypothetical protein